MPNLKGLNLNIDSNQDRLEKTPSWTERLGNKLSVLTPQSVTEPGFVGALAQPTDAPRDMSNFSSYMGSGLRRGIVDPLKRYAMAVEKGMTGQTLSAVDILAITEVNMDVAMGGFLKKGIDPNKIRSFPAWHGGATSFDKFADHAIGSGEGVQAFGPGHYLTDSRGIADSYAKTVAAAAKEAHYTYKGKKLDPIGNYDTPEEYALGILNEGLVETSGDSKADIRREITHLKEVGREELERKNTGAGSDYGLDDEDMTGNYSYEDFIDGLYEFTDKLMEDDFNFKSGNEVFYNGKKTLTSEDIFEGVVDLDDLNAKEKVELAMATIIKENTLPSKDIKRIAKNHVISIMGEDENELIKYAKEIDNINVSAFELKTAQKNLYKTTIMKNKAPDEYDFINWHKPLNQQDVKLNFSEEQLSDLRKDQVWNDFETDAEKILPGGLKETSVEEFALYLEDFENQDYVVDFLKRHPFVDLNKKSRVMEKLKTTDIWKGMEEVHVEEGLKMDENMTISQFIERAEQMFVPEEELIKELQKAGLPGIVYDAGTIAGGAKPGTKNYVVFNPDDISIDEHYVDGILQKPTD